MKKYLTGKPVYVVILAVLFILSLANVILRATVFNDLSLIDYGEATITAVLSGMLILFALKGKDRIFYILCGAWLSCFVLMQLFEIPEMIATLVNYDIAQINSIISYLLYIIISVCIIAIGSLLVEYMNNGSIYNKAFRILCIVTLALSLLLFFHGLNDTFAFGRTYAILVSLNAMTRGTMVFLFACFAHDTARQQLAKTKR